MERFSICQVSDYFSYPSCCRDLTDLLHCWLIDDVNLQETVPPAAKFFKIFSSWILKNSSWIIPKEVTLKGISRLVPQPALRQTELGMWNRWVSLSYLLGETTSRFPDNFHIIPLCNSVKWWSMFKTKRQDAKIVDHISGEISVLSGKQFAQSISQSLVFFLPNMVNIFSL